MKKLLYAFRFLTILPIPWKQDEDLTKVARSSTYFPIVGLIIGFFLLGMATLLKLLVSPLTIGVIIVVTWIIITGGLHLDGLSDLFDGFGGKSKEDKLRIMKDSHIGAFGTLSLILLIILKIVFVMELLLPNTYNLYPLLLAPMWGRLMQLLVINFFKSARPDGMGNFFKVAIRVREWLIPLIYTTVITVFLFHLFGLIIIGILVLVIMVFSNSISRKLDGLTGDCYGAICEITETLFIFLTLLKLG